MLMIIGFPFYRFLFKAYLSVSLSLLFHCSICLLSITPPPTHTHTFCLPAFSLSLAFLFFLTLTVLLVGLFLITCLFCDWWSVLPVIVTDLFFGSYTTSQVASLHTTGSTLSVYVCVGVWGWSCVQNVCPE
ncbi:hypothetical protein KOW79_015081 [Hemibagrus wyckioides]|uniref:Uncharacterized protein n=1 Tax=Hemibagrus wyckioides TaxID=337641 RepID=A0A9D3NFZ9_9TELE|nr:hypothetical protein KOW79_015081 [Hemibagrus wyckioides]